MNILFVAEKRSIVKLYQEIINEHKDVFIDNYYFDYIRFVTHFNDNVLRMHKKNNNYYLMGKKSNFRELKLNIMDIPNDTFLESMDSTFCYNEDIDVTKMDKVISICDPDDCGCLAFAKYLEVKGIKEAYVLLTNDLTPSLLYEKLKQQDFLNAYEYIDTVKKQLIENEFCAQWPRDTNVWLLRELCNMKRQEFANYFNIPYRTLENWEKDTSPIPKYLYDLMEYKLINEGLLLKD